MYYKTTLYFNLVQLGDMFPEVVESAVGAILEAVKLAVGVSEEEVNGAAAVNGSPEVDSVGLHTDLMAATTDLMAATTTTTDLMAATTTTTDLMAVTTIIMVLMAVTTIIMVLMAETDSTE
jgi:hypothetical protein